MPPHHQCVLFCKDIEEELIWGGEEIVGVLRGVEREETAVRM